MYSRVEGPVGPAEMVAPAKAVPPPGVGKDAARAGGSWELFGTIPGPT